MPSHTRSVSGNNHVIGADPIFDTGNAAGSMSQGSVICTSIAAINKGNANDDYDDFHLWNNSGAQYAARTDSVFIDGVTLTNLVSQGGSGGACGVNPSLATPGQRRHGHSAGKHRPEPAILSSV
jgi:hypothetical protein